MTRVPLTTRGAKMLRDELNDLKSVQRPQVIQDIAEARAHGDLKENAEYHAARDQQGFIEGRIQAIESKLGNAQIIDVTTIDAQGRVVFGSTVTLFDADSEEQIAYRIVGDDESDIKQGLISFGSPVAKALIGKQEGDEVGVRTPGGVREYEIVSVEYV